MFKVIIYGAESLDDYPEFVKKCTYFLKNKAKEGITIYSAGDKFAEAFAERYHIDYRFFPTEWEIYGRDALKNRNEEMLSDCDAAIIFADGKKDTNILIKTIKEREIPLRLVKLT